MLSIEGLEESDFPGEFGVVGSYHASVAHGGHVFEALETEAGSVADRADHFALIGIAGGHGRRLPGRASRAGGRF